MKDQDIFRSVELSHEILEWPLRSPDLSLLAFFSLRTFEMQRNKPTNIEEFDREKFFEGIVGQ